MKLFSKRNTILGSISAEERRTSASFRARRSELISIEARNRLIAEIKFLSSRDDFLEGFIFFENAKEETIFFDVNKIDSFSLAELGYSMSDYFEFENFKMVQIEFKLYDDRTEKYFDDYKLFDLAEITILFARPDRRNDVINRFNLIFSEEEVNYEIVQHLITRKSGESLKSLKNILKDSTLKTKLNSYLDYESRGDHLNAAKLSAEIVNIIFSGYIKDSKPAVIKELKGKLVNALLSPSDAKTEKGTKLEAHIESILNVAKNLSNDIYDIRHTEQSTLEIRNDNIYKLVSNNNRSIIELVLTTLKDEYVISDDWENIKKEYIEKYKIDKTTRLYIPKPAPDEIIDLSEVPF